ncbi:hypothetical protein [Actinocrispum sp. NPDC049592]|uniref:hypothetical protein n=1 Tax=Actinocrispum sp. NPDC049592 TaxID=3154835 RepID=UPI0034233F84
MSTEFNDRAAHDRPLNDRLSDVPPRDRDTDDTRDTLDTADTGETLGTADTGETLGTGETFGSGDTVAEGAETDEPRSTAAKGRTRFEQPESGVDTEPESRMDVRAEPVTDELPAQETAAGSAQNVVPQQENRTSLFEEQEAEKFRTQWREVQSTFVDEPKTAVREADTLLAKMMDELKTRIESNRNDLGNGDTEQMRLAMQRYRSLFDQILSV